VIIGQSRPLLGAVLLLGGWQGAEALVPVLVGVIIDEAVATGDVAALARWLVVLAVLFTALTLGYRFGARLTARAREYAGLDLRLAVTRRILDPRGGTGIGRRPGELLSIATADVSRVAEIVEVVAGAVIAASGLTIAAVVLLNASVQLGLVVLVGLPPVLALLNLLTRRPGPVGGHHPAAPSRPGRTDRQAHRFLGRRLRRRARLHDRSRGSH